MFICDAEADLLSIEKVCGKCYHFVNVTNAQYILPTFVIHTHTHRYIDKKKKAQFLNPICMKIMSEWFEYVIENVTQSNKNAVFLVVLFVLLLGASSLYMLLNTPA